MPQSPTTNMLLVQPSENGDAGTWDTLLTALFLLVDAHDHSTGKGVTVKTAGISINADLSCSSAGVFYALKDVKAVDFQPTAAASMTAYAGALWVNSSDSNNLYFRTQSGTNVRITNGTSLDITSSGGIAGDYISTGAEVAYSDAGKEYTFKQKDPDNFWAALRCGPLRVAQLDTTESVYVEMIAPAALGGTYTITLPTAAPASTSPLYMTSAGVLSAGPSQTIEFPASAAMVANDLAQYIDAQSNPGGYVQSKVGAAMIADFPLTPTLRTGDRITAITVNLKEANLAGEEVSTSIWRLSSVGASTQLSTTKTSGVTNANATLSYSTADAGFSPSGFTLLTGERLVLKVNLNASSGAGESRCYGISVTYDHP